MQCAIQGYLLTGGMGHVLSMVTAATSLLCITEKSHKYYSLYKYILAVGPQCCNQGRPGNLHCVMFIPRNMKFYIFIKGSDDFELACASLSLWVGILIIVIVI